MKIKIKIHEDRSGIQLTTSHEHCDHTLDLESFRDVMDLWEACEKWLKDECLNRISEAEKKKFMIQPGFYMSKLKEGLDNMQWSKE